MSLYSNGLPGCYPTPTPGAALGVMAQNVNGCEKRQPEIAGAADSLGSTLGYTAELVARLAERLAPFLRAPATNACNEGTPPYVCEFGARLGHFRRGASQTNEVLLDILDRLEI